MPIRPSSHPVLSLPKPKLRSRFSLERALFERRSIREFTRSSIALDTLGQLLWSCQGITSENGLRTAPSAGGISPLEIFAVAEHVSGLTAGIYRYIPGPGVNEHHLRLVKAGRFGEEIFSLTTQQEFIKRVAVNILLTATTERMAKEYGTDLAPRFIHMEMGHAAQNVHLQAEALGLGSVAVGYLQETRIRELLACEGVPQYMV
ncbi:MAG: SagB/ThcOx family dehydrogenase, partial [bacterium]|nr:SagB/ThcOx family dehydrogenase [bacterium]